MNDPSQPADENMDFTDLLASYCNGTITSAEFEHLKQRLYEDDSARESFRRYMNLDAALHDEQVLLDTHVSPIEQTSDISQVLASTDRESVDPPTTHPSAIVIEERSTNLLRRTKRYDSIHWQRHKIRFNAMTAVLTALAWVGFSYFLWSSTTPNGSQPNRGDSFQYVAEITGQYESRWVEGMSTMSNRTALLSGDRLNLAEGLVEITFDDGAIVVLEGPTEFVIDSSGAGTLANGRLAANVPKEAIGFAVSTPELRLVDMGTQFGVSVEGGYGTEVHVFKGFVEVYHGERNHHPVRLGQGGRFAVDATGAVRSVTAGTELPFVLNLPRSPYESIVQINEDSIVDGAFDDVSSTDLINQGQSTLLSHVRSPDGLFGDNTNDGGGVANGDDSEFWFAEDQPNTLTYTLDTTVNTLGYDITQIQTVSGWSTASKSEANQDFELLVSTVESAAFTSLGSFSHLPFPDADSAGFYSARITLTGDTGVIASGVDEVRFIFAVASFGGSFPGLVIREIDVDGVAVELHEEVENPDPNQSQTIGGM